MKLKIARQTRERVNMASTVHDQTGLQIIIPQASQLSSHFMSSILDSSDEDNWMVDSSFAEDMEEDRAERQDIELISVVRVKKTFAALLHPDSVKILRYTRFIRLQTIIKLTVLESAAATYRM